MPGAPETIPECLILTHLCPVQRPPASCIRGHLSLLNREPYPPLAQMLSCLLEGSRTLGLSLGHRNISGWMIPDAERSGRQLHSTRRGPRPSGQWEGPRPSSVEISLGLKARPGVSQAAHTKGSAHRRPLAPPPPGGGPGWPATKFAAVCTHKDPPSCRRRLCAAYPEKQRPPAPCLPAGMLLHVASFSAQ